MTYDVEIGNAIEKKELPFVVGVLADLFGQAPADDRASFKERSFVNVDRDNFDKILASIAPKAHLRLDGSGLDLSFKCFEDFSPHNLVQNTPDLKKLMDQRVCLTDLLAKVDGNDALHAALTALGKDAEHLTFCADGNSEALTVVSESAQTPANRRSEMEKNIAVFSAQRALVETPADDAYALILQEISALDAALSKRLDAILHHPDFQKLEGSWRGLRYLVVNTETSASLKIRLLPATQDEIVDDLTKAIEFDQSALFKKIYESEFGTFGGQPYSCLLMDFAFGRSPEDVETLRLFSGLAAAAHMPTFAAASPHMFDMDTFTQLGAPRDLQKIFEGSDCISWNSFRETEDARYISLLLPRVLMRLPYGPNGIPVKTFGYVETVVGEGLETFCWGNPVYAMGQRIGNAYAHYGWTAAIRGVEGGGMLENLPSYTFETPRGDKVAKAAVETIITDRRENELSKLGFIALCQWKFRDRAVFFGAQSVQKPKEYIEADATANARLSARTTYMLNASRFAHYVKMMMREKLGAFTEAAGIQKYLQSWLAQYVLLSDTAPQAMRAKYPLRAGSVQVSEVPSDPGVYQATLFLRPHFQFEGMSASIRLVARLTPAMLK